VPEGKRFRGSAFRGKRGVLCRDPIPSVIVLPKLVEMRGRREGRESERFARNPKWNCRTLKRERREER